MIPILSGNVASGLGGAYDVANSLRFNDGSSDYISKTLGTASNRKIFTVSYWIKKTTNGLHTPIVEVASSGGSIGGSENAAYIAFNTSDKLNWYETHGGGVINLTTNRQFRDPNAWYHIMYAVDTTQGTSTNRIKLYVNGTQETSFDSGASTYPSENLESYINSNQDATYIGRSRYSNKYFDGYMCEVVHVDGTAQSPTDLGEFDEDSPNIWKPKNVSGLTFGTNGFYLDFESSGSLGNDAAGSNNFTVNNLTSIDQSTDTCTNNFATLNVLDNYYAASTFSEGNCKIVTTSGNITYNTSTIGFSSGKWYIENKVGTSSGSVIGPITGVSTGNNNDNKIGNRSDGWGYDYRGLVEHIGADVGGSFATYGAGDIIGVYIDLDNNELYFAKNGTLQNSGTGLALTAGLTYFFATGDNNNGVAITHEVNFGNPTYSISSGNTDPNGYGNFEYDPSSGTFDGSSKSFYALNTKNLAEFG